MAGPGVLRPVPGGDRSTPLTRIVALAIVPFLVLAFLVLYLVPGETGERFAWEIKPALMSRFIGAGYLGGAWFFVRVVLGAPWHQVANGFASVTAFAWAMLAATWLHWDRFSIDHLPFQLWLVLYVVTPVLVPTIWRLNRAADPANRAADDLEVPARSRTIMGTVGGAFLALALASLVSPSALMGFWPWALTPLTARVLGGWFLLLGVGGLVISRDDRWSAWRIPLQSIIVWQGLVLVAVLLDPDAVGGLVGWYPGVLLVGVAVLVGLHVWLDRVSERTRMTARLDGAG